MQDIRRMQLGQVVDFCIDYNKRQTRSGNVAEKPVKRKATQADIDGFFGG